MAATSYRSVRATVWLLTPSMPLHNCSATQGVRTQGTVETTQAVGLSEAWTRDCLLL